jgi:hypothetical protein
MKLNSLTHTIRLIGAALIHTFRHCPGTRATGLLQHTATALRARLLAAPTTMSELPTRRRPALSGPESSDVGRGAALVPLWLAGSSIDAHCFTSRQLAASALSFELAAAFATRSAFVAELCLELRELHPSGLLHVLLNER